MHSFFYRIQENPGKRDRFCAVKKVFAFCMPLNPGLVDLKNPRHPGAVIFWQNFAERPV